MRDFGKQHWMVRNSVVSACLFGRRVAYMCATDEAARNGYDIAMSVVGDIGTASNEYPKVEFHGGGCVEFVVPPASEVNPTPKEQ